jgi:uncharacterized phiE125 gp8 family phage protein
MSKTLDLELVTGPTDEPVTLSEAKLQCKVEEDFTADDSYINSLIQAARSEIERKTNFALLTQTWKMFLQSWPGVDFIELPKPPLQSVTSIKYLDYDGNEQTFDAANYDVHTGRIPGYISLKPSKSWPSESLYPHDPIYIEWVAGYTGPAKIENRELIQAAKLIIAHWYQNREPVLLGQGANLASIPGGVDVLLIDARMRAKRHKK